MTDYRSHFPIFSANPDLVYLDSAATAQKPSAVIEAVDSFYRTSYATIHRGLYPLSLEASAQYEATRETVASFLGGTAQEIVFTSGATESLNLLAHSLPQTWEAGDEIILSLAEHHANLVPWQEAARRHGLHLIFLPLTETGEIDLQTLPALLSERTKAVALTHCSNVLGSITPIARVKKILDQQGSQALLIVDASQSIPHFPVNVQELGADFLVFSSHKLYGPSGVGVLWGREELLAQLPPYQTGGDMVQTVTTNGATWNPAPSLLEAGTPNIEGAIGLKAAVEFLQEIGMGQVGEHTKFLAQQALTGLKEITQVTIIGSPDPRSGIISFVVKGIHPHDIAELLGAQQICIRAGHHCAAPLHQHLEISASNRMSIGLYTTAQDIERFLAALKTIISDIKKA